MRPARFPLAYRAAAAGLAAAAGAVAHAQEPAASLRGLPDGDAFALARSAVGEVEGPPASLFDARRRAQKAASRVLAALRSEGYYAARVEARAEPGEPAKAIVEVEPGVRFKFADARLVFDGAAPAPEAAAAARDALGLRTDAPARAEDVLAAERRAVAALAGAGYPDAAAGDRETVVDHARSAMDVVFQVRAGSRARFGPVVTQGSGRARPDFIARLKTYEDGERYDPEKLGELSRRLSDTGAFQGVNVRLAAPDDPDVTIARAPDGAEVRPVLVRLREGERRTIALGGSWSTSEGVGVEAEWTRRNLRGGAEQLTVLARVKTIERRLETDLAVPHWRRVNRTLRLNVGLLQEETDAYDRGAIEAGARIEQPMFKKALLTLGTGVSVSEVREDNLLNDVEKTPDTYALITGAGAIAWDAADDPLDPTRGFKARAAIEPAIGVGDEGLGFVTATASASVYRTLKPDRVVAAARVRMGSVIGPPLENVPADRRFFAGGGGSVRGYEYQALSPRDADGVLIGGLSVVEASAEVRLRLRGKIGAAVFVDGGAAGRDATPDFAAMKWGAGIGLRYDMGFGPLRADIAVPLDREDGDAGVQVYISIGQAF